MSIHSEHPFTSPPEDRDPVRRFRGRLAAGVTIVTSGDGERKTGLTVSSLFVVEGDPGLIYAVVSPNSDLWDLVGASGRFVVHICTGRQRERADVFAGIRPNPGGLFAGSDVVDSEWGPVLTDMEDRLLCTLLDREEVGWSGLIRGQVDHVEIGPTEDPLVHFRGRYRELG